MITGPEIPEEAADELAGFLHGLEHDRLNSRCPGSDDCQLWYDAEFRAAALLPALPHLRVQETRWVTIEDADDDSDEPWPSGLSPDNPFLTPQAEYIHVHSNGPDPADCTTCEPPAPRPVVDREALEKRCKS